MAIKLATVNDFAKYFNDLVKNGKGDYNVDATHKSSREELVIWK